MTGQFLSLVLPTGTLLAIDDAHFMDDASADVFKHVCLTVADRPWLLLLTRRDQPGGFVPPPAADPTALRLEPLDQEASRGLVSLTTEDAPLAPHQIDAVVARSGGNPLFLLGLVRTAQSAGGVDELPGSVEDLVTSQIDRLAPSERTVLRHAAVLGLSFTEAQVRSLLEGETLPSGRDGMRRLAGFIRAEGHGRMRFQQTLVRDVAYEGLPYRRRQVLHGRAGELLEAEAGDPDDQSELLSLHFFNAGRLDKAWHYSVVAGARAADKYAYVEATEFYRRAAAAARGVPGLDPTEVADVNESLGDAQHRIGVLPAAKTAYRTARRQVADDPRRVSELMRKEALVDHDLDQVPTALRALSRAMRLLDGVDEPWAVAQRGHLEASYAGCRHEQGRYRDAIRWALRAQEHAEATSDPRALAEAYEVLQMSHTLAGLPQPQPYGPMALAIFEELGDRSAQARALNNLAVLAWMEGHGRQALDMLGRAQEAFAAAGDTLHAAMTDYNRGDVLLRLNHVTEAAVLLRSLLPVFRALASDNYWAPTLRGVGLAEVRSGRVEEGLEHLQRARATLAGLGFAAEVLETDAAIAEAFLAAGDWSAAADLADDGAVRADALGAGYLLPVLDRLHGVALLRLGDLDGARERLDRALALCEEQAPTERGFVLADLAEVADAVGDRTTAADLRTASAAALADLGYDPSPR